MESTNRGYQRILVAVDFEHSPADVIDRAVRIAREDGAKLKLLHCVPPIEEVYINAYGLADVPAVGDFREIQLGAVKESQKRLEKLGLNYEDLDLECSAIGGITVDSIVESAEDFGADLIVLGSHGKHGIKLLLGSVASGVLHKSPCDTLMVRI